MPRDLPIANGSLLVNFDAMYQLRDLYWPRIGQENHTAGHPFRFGVWVEGQFRWIDDASWQRTLEYMPDTLVTAVTLSNDQLALSLECQDCVDFHENLYLRKIIVHNNTPRDREVRLFFGQDFHIDSYAVGDSAYYEPERQAVFHYKGMRWFIINCAKESQGAWELGIDQWAVGVKEALQHEGTWRDAEDGVLSGNAVAQGSVDSCVALHLTVPANGVAVGWYWIGVGNKFTEVTRVNRVVRQKGPQTLLKRTCHYWKLWVAKEEEDLSVLPDAIRHLYRRSLLILRTQIDNGGAILAATDYDVARYFSDTYAYMWPRDGALV
ncbi:MAG TPA: glycoside hydrolase family 15 protein, partial [Armatimonadota bacterium]